MIILDTSLHCKVVVLSGPNGATEVSHSHDHLTMSLKSNSSAIRRGQRSTLHYHRLSLPGLVAFFYPFSFSFSLSRQLSLLPSMISIRDPPLYLPLPFLGTTDRQLSSNRWSFLGLTCRFSPCSF